MNQLIPMCIMGALVGVIALSFILMSTYLGPRMPNPVKDSPFECGHPSDGYNRGVMPVHFYVMALLFVVFDVELAFLFPWAVVFRRLELFGFIEMLVFTLVVGAGFIYAWKMGALEWD
jgi:NADH-quinone oxidoreductase subunit A